MARAASTRSHKQPARCHSTQRSRVMGDYAVSLQCLVHASVWVAVGQRQTSCKSCECVIRAYCLLVRAPVYSWNMVMVAWYRVQLATTTQTRLADILCTHPCSNTCKEGTTGHYAWLRDNVRTAAWPCPTEEQETRMTYTRSTCQLRAGCSSTNPVVELGNLSCGQDSARPQAAR